VIRRLIPQLSKQAQKDVAAIYRDIARDDPIAAKRLLDLIDGKISSLAASGNKGISRDWLSPGLRAFPFKNRCIYFRVLGSSMRVVRVLHGRQDVQPEMLETENKS
jgi:plasmid stabilization system protein ParE